tara:strand:+ start:263 stop:643 length:381 start_codon:yes stop_codon:yes gene_type:complete
MAIVTLIKKNVSGGRTITAGVLFIRNRPVKDLTADFAVSFVGSPEYNVELSASEVNSISDKKLKHLPRILGVETIEEAKKILNPNSVKKSITTKVKTQIEKVLPLSKDTDNIESDENSPLLADEAE